MILQRKFGLWRMVFVLFVLIFAVLIWWRMFLFYKLYVTEKAIQDFGKEVEIVRSGLVAEKMKDNHKKFMLAKTLLDNVKVVKWKKIYEELYIVKNDLTSDFKEGDYKFEMDITKDKVQIVTTSKDFVTLYWNNGLYERLEKKRLCYKNKLILIQYW